MTRREFFVQSTKFQFLKLVRDTPVIDLNRADNSTIYQFSAFFKYSIINSYDPVCVINHCYVCGRSLIYYFLLFDLFNININVLFIRFHDNLGDAHYMHDINIWICKPNSYNTVITGYFQSPPSSFPPPPTFSPMFLSVDPYSIFPIPIRLQYLLKFAFHFQGKILTLSSEQYYHSPFSY